jgi:uncharacterized membrane protein
MNYPILLMLCLIIVGFTLIALGVHFLLGQRQNLNGGPYKHQPAKGGKDMRCGCGRGNCCAIE